MPIRISKNRVALENIPLNLAQELNVASATTTNIGATLSNNILITGTTAITAFDNVAPGIWRFLRFGNVLTLTHNATSLILPGGANITTAAGDSALAVSLGSGNWKVHFYQRTPSLGTAATHADTEYVHTTGTETVAGIKTFTSNLKVGDSASGGKLTIVGIGGVVDNFSLRNDSGNNYVRLVADTTPASAFIEMNNLGSVMLGAATGGQKGANTINAASGIYDNGTRLLNTAFQAWDATKSANTVYQAATDGFVVAHFTTTGGYWGLAGLTDSANPPTTLRARTSNRTNLNEFSGCLTMPVKKNDYWRVDDMVGDGAGARTVFWIPAAA